VTEEFREGWDFVQSGDVHWLDKKIRRYGWHFFRIVEGSLKVAFGQTPQEAIASALKSALPCVSGGFNAAEVGHIELKEYPWFVLATVRVYPYQIQKNAILSVSDEPASLWMRPPVMVVTKANQVESESSKRTHLTSLTELFSSARVSASLKQSIRRRVRIIGSLMVLS
jgi:hypothetical protein